MRSRQYLSLILTAYFILAVIYNFTTPPFEAPDENWHFQYVVHVAVTHSLPVVNPAAEQPFRHEGLQAPLYYTLASLFLTGLNPDELNAVETKNPFQRIGEPLFGSNDNRNAFVHGQDLTAPMAGQALGLHLVRLFSTLLGAGTILFTFLLARGVFPRAEPNGFEPIPLLAAAFVALLPQFIFVNSTVSNDSATILASTIILLELVRLVRLGLSTQRAVILGITLGIALLTKLSALTLVPLSLLVLAFVTWRTRAWRAGITSIAIVLVIAALIGGWWYARNYLLYGDPMYTDTLAKLVGERPSALSFVQWVRTEAEGTVLSAWGVFGWFNLLAPAPYYWFYFGLAGAGIVGMGYALFRAYRQRAYPPDALVLLPIWICIVVLALWRFSALIISNQGRLLFPALPAYAVLWAWGILSLIPMIGRRWVTLFLPIPFVLLAAYVPSKIIAPAYQPTIAASDASFTPGKVEFENGVEWRGVGFDRTTVTTGESVDVTIYYQLTAPLPATQSIFVHLVNSANVIVAQRDSLIGEGNPNRLVPNLLYADTYRVSIPYPAPAPDTWTIQAGMYDANSGERILTGEHADSVSLGNIQAESASVWNYDFDGAAVLERADLGAQQVKAGATIRLTMNWQPTGSARPLRVFVHALGDADHIWASAGAALDDYKATRLELQFDPRTPPGVYPLEFGVETAEGDRLEVFDEHGLDLGDRLFLGPIRVAAP